MPSYTNPSGPQPVNPDGPSYGGGDLLSTLVQVGGAIYNARQERKNTKDTIKANKEQSEYAYQKELEMWERMNAYNDPSAQMARYEAAGLNANMIYGSGGSAGNASSMPKYQTPNIDYRGMPAAIDVPAVISAYQNFQMRQAQTDNVKAQTQNIQARTANEDLRGFLFDYQGKKAKQSFDFLDNTNTYNATIRENQARLSGLKLTREALEQEGIDSRNFLMDQQYEFNKQTMSDRVDLVKARRENEQAQLLFNQYKNQWAAMGITSSDNIAFRAIARMLGESGLGMSDFMKFNYKKQYKP